MGYYYLYKDILDVHSGDFHSKEPKIIAMKTLIEELEQVLEVLIAQDRRNVLSEKLESALISYTEWVPGHSW